METQSRNTTTKRPSVTVRAARWSATHPWRAIGLWLAFVTVAVATMSIVPTQQASDDDGRVGESGRAAALVADAGLSDPATEAVLITDRDGALDPSAAQAAAREVRERTRTLPGVKDVGQPVWSKSRDALLVPLTLSGDEAATSEHVGAILRATKSVQKSHPELGVAQAGDASIGADIDDTVGKDLASAEALSLPISFVILLVAFGALIAAGIPVLLAISSVLAALGLYAPLSFLTPDSGSVANVVLLIGMAVGVDYSLFYLKREREERRRGHRTIDAIEIAAATSGRAVVVSGFAVMVAMSGLFLAGDSTFGALATGSILVVAVAVLGSLTVVPALLAKVGRFVDRPRVPLLWRLNDRIGAGGISGRLIRPVIGHPRIAAVAATGVLVALAAPAVGMTLHQSTIDTLPSRLPSVRAYKAIQSEFPAQHPSIDVAVRTTPTRADDVREALGTVADRSHAAALTAAAGTDAVRMSDDRRTAVLSMQTAGAEGDPANEDAVATIRHTIVPRASAGLTETTWEVGGSIAEDKDWTDGQTSVLPWVVAFVLGLTLVMVGWTFRSVTIALLTTALNLLSVGAAFGVMTLVFQHSWADGLLHYRSSGYIVDWIPLFCFVILIGLSMDYHVFVLSRVREGVRNGLPHWLAVEYGIRETASVVTSAATVMISVFAVFATLSMLEMKQLGVGLSVAILIDATIVRLVLLPALLLMLEKPLAKLGRQPDPIEELVLEPAPA